MLDIHPGLLSYLAGMEGSTITIPNDVGHGGKGEPVGVEKPHKHVVERLYLSFREIVLQTPFLLLGSLAISGSTHKKEGKH